MMISMTFRNEERLNKEEGAAVLLIGIQEERVSTLMSDMISTGDDLKE